MPQKAPPTTADLLAQLRTMGDDYICKPRQMKGKELIKHAGLIWAAHQLDPKWTSQLTILELDQEAGRCVVLAEVVLAGARHQNIGEAAPNNLGSMVKVYPASMASTRALSRALKAATGISMLSFEEMGSWEAHAPHNDVAGSGKTPPASRQTDSTQAKPAASTPSRPPDTVSRRPNPDGGHQAGDPCPSCGEAMWDNRFNKRNPRGPDFKCKDKGCGKAIWLTEKPKQAPAPGPNAYDPEIPF